MGITSEEFNIIYEGKKQWKCATCKIEVKVSVYQESHSEMLQQEILKRIKQTKSELEDLTNIKKKI